MSLCFVTSGCKNKHASGMPISSIIWGPVLILSLGCMLYWSQTTEISEYMTIYPVVTLLVTQYKVCCARTGTKVHKGNPSLVISALLHTWSISLWRKYLFVSMVLIVDNNSIVLASLVWFCVFCFTCTSQLMMRSWEKSSKTREDYITQVKGKIHYHLLEILNVLGKWFCATEDE